MALDPSVQDALKKLGIATPDAPAAAAPVVDPAAPTTTAIPKPAAQPQAPAPARDPALDIVFSRGAQPAPAPTPKPPTTIADRVKQMPGDFEAGVTEISDRLTGKGKEELPELSNQVQLKGAPFGATSRILAGYLTSATPQQVANIAQGALPGSTLRNDAKGYPVIRFQDRDYYINKPGVSDADMKQFAGAMLAFAPSGWLAKTVPWLIARVPATFAAAGGTSLLTDLASKALGSKTDPDLGRAAAAGGTSAVATAAAPLFQPKVFPDPKTAGRSTAADQFDIPLTKGQATQDAGQLAFEQQTRSGQRGPMARGVIANADDAAATAKTEAEDGIQRAVAANGKPLAAREQDAAATVRAGVQNEAADRKAVVGETYDRAAANPAYLHSAELKRLPAKVAAKIKGVFTTGLKPTSQPKTKDMLDAITTATQVTGRVSTNDLEALRQELRALADGATGADAKSAKLVIDGFDEWADAADAAGKFTGSPEALTLYRDARAANAEWQRLFNQNDTAGVGSSKDKAGAIVAKIVNPDNNLTPQEVAELLYGNASLKDQTSANVAMKLKRIVGDASDEWSALRQGAFLRVVGRDAAGNAANAQTVVKAIDDAMKGKGAGVTTVLFTPEERQLMLQYRDALKALVPSKAAYSPSGAAISTLYKKLAATVGGAAGGAAGAAVAGVPGATAGAMVGAAVGAGAPQALDAARALRAVRGPMVTAPPPAHLVPLVESARRGSQRP